MKYKTKLMKPEEDPLYRDIDRLLAETKELLRQGDQLMRQLAQEDQKKHEDKNASRE